MIQTIGIVGAGTMGAGIALVCMRSGYQVVIQDRSEEILQKARSYHEEMLTKDVQKGKKTEAEREQIISSTIYTQEMGAFSACEVVLEAIPEKLEWKQEVFAQLESICSDTTLLLSNTSSISITAIAAKLSQPQRVLGMHFFNPAPVMRLVEVVQGMKSDPVYVQQVVQLTQDLGKIPVEVQDTPGFLVNRIARPFYNESLRILGDRIASVEQIDRILKQAGGFQMGPFALQDLIGIDVNYATTESVYTDFFYEKRFQPSRIQQRMVQAGTLGRKSGGGYYDYEN